MTNDSVEILNKAVKFVPSLAESFRDFLRNSLIYWAETAYGDRRLIMH